jgi:hypothetical protein
MEENKVFAEEREKLQKLSDFCGIVPDQRIFATPPVFKRDLPDQSDRWPVFEFRPADGLDFNHDLDRKEIYDDASRVILGKIRILKLKRGCRNWKNFPFGNPLPCPKDAEGNLTDQAVQMMSPELQNWALGIINGLETISSEESDGLKF